MPKGKGKQKQPKAQKPKGMSNGSTTSVPKAVASTLPKVFFQSVASSVPGAVRFRGCEIIRELTVKTAFTSLVNYLMNPGNAKSFPRLSTVSVAFETFKFHDLKVRYYPSCGTDISGAIAMMLDYDAADVCAPTMVQFLANESVAAGPAFAPQNIHADLRKLPYERYFVRAVQVNRGTDLTVASQRQENPFRLRVVTDKASSTHSGVFTGYLAVEYDVEFFNAKPTTPTSIAGRNVNPVVVAPAGNVSIPANEILSDEGVTPGDSDESTTAYNTAGGISNTLDALKAAYETGTWLAGVISEWTAAAVPDPDSRPGPIRKTSASQALLIEDHEDYKSGVVQSGRMQRRWLSGADAATAAPLSLSSGDVQVDCEVYDVTAPLPFHIDFPAVVTGMTLVDTFQQVISLGTGAVSANSGRYFNVPEGKNYVWRPKFTLGPTTGRTCNFVRVTTNASAESDI